MTKESDATEVIPLVDFKADYAKHGQATTEAMAAVARSGMFILGPPVGELEEKLSAFLEPDASKPRIHSIGVSDGTAALQLCLMALGVGPGDEVITTPFSWISTVEVIALVGATPVFADIADDDTYLLSAASVQAAVTSRTRAVIAVSLFGLAPDFGALRAALDAAELETQGGSGRRIAIVEDAAQSFGARCVDGALSCASPHVAMATTSFFPTKPLGGYGDGGAVFTADDSLAKAVRSLRVHGKQQSGGATFGRVGLNSRLDTVQAGVLLAKLPALGDMLQARDAAAQRYRALLGDDERIVLPGCGTAGDGGAGGRSGSSGRRCAWGVYTVRVRRRDEVMAKMKEANVRCAVYYKRCMHEEDAYKRWAPEERGKLAVAERMTKSVLALPMHAYLSEAVQARVARELRTALDDLDVKTRPE